VCEFKSSIILFAISLVRLLVASVCAIFYHSGRYGGYNMWGWGMDKTDIIVMLKLLIMFNATKIGWTISEENGKLILTKPIDKMTMLDKDRRRLLTILTN
jgi:hypothetical protein